MTMPQSCARNQAFPSLWSSLPQSFRRLEAVRGTEVPRSVKCHRAVELTQIRESIMRLGRNDPGDNLPHASAR